MKNKINIRFVGIAVLAVIVTMIGVTSVYYKLFKVQIRNDLAVCAKLLKDTHFFEEVGIDTDSIDLSTDIEELRVTWIAEDGLVIYDNDNDALMLENHSDRPEIKNAMRDGEGESVRKSSTMNKNTFYYAVRLDNGTILRVSTEAQSILSVFTMAAPLIAVIIICIVLVCVVLSHFLTKQLIRPIEEVADNIEDSTIDTPYKELEPFANMIRKQHADILSAAKARQDFTANVSHELKTPLTAISGYAELLELSPSMQEQEIHFCKEIRRNSDRLLTLINDIIRLSDLDRSEKEPAFYDIDLYDTVSECIEGLRIGASKKGINLEFFGEHCRIRGNKELICELTENLVQNGIRYNNPGGKVCVSISKKDSPSLIVRDNGIGIPASEQERVFERFYRVDKSRSKATGGTGLGLAIVKHIVEIHDAKIFLDSALGVGTTIEVKF